MVIDGDHLAFPLRGLGVTDASAVIPALLSRRLVALAQRQRRPPVQHPQRQRRALIVRQVAPV